MSTIQEGKIQANGLEFGYLEAGTGPLVLCMHGFPDTANSYRHLLPALADAGFHAVAPFMRGYAPSQIPTDGVYQTAAFGQDTIWGTSRRTSSATIGVLLRWQLPPCWPRNGCAGWSPWPCPMAAAWALRS